VYIYFDNQLNHRLIQATANNKVNPTLPNFFFVAHMRDVSQLEHYQDIGLSRARSGPTGRNGLRLAILPYWTQIPDV
jgi:hypothetical protein